MALFKVGTFVLELTQLRLCHEAADDGWMAILDPSTRGRLGVVREAQRSWFGPRTLEIYESDDESLVFQMQRGLLPGWVISDSEGQRIGRLSGWQTVTLEDATGQLLATVVADTGSMNIIAGEGHELGRFTHSAAGVEVSFNAEIMGDPFVKMLVLAAAIARE